ncbi:MAG TPA: hypothetical protein VK468_05300, partial [Pyrinomonadaceae bacterium]|nr:hypothetical protein [Pyrinomonadaceae bacterium]
RCKLPTDNISVRYAGEVVCTAELDAPGDVFMKLPDAVLKKIQVGRAILVPNILPSDPPEEIDGDTAVQLVSIHVRDYP